VPPPAKVRELIEKGWRVYAFVDDQGSNLAQLRELERAGLVGQVRIVPIGPPRDAPRVHPYLN